MVCCDLVMKTTDPGSKEHLQDVTKAEVGVVTYLLGFHLSGKFRRSNDVPFLTKADRNTQ